MKHLVTLFLIVTFLTSYAQDLPQVPKSESMDSLQTKVMKLMDFYESYDDGSPESLKKAKYNDAVDEMSGGTATQKDKADAYQIIDAYIKGDKALEQDADTKQDTDSLEDVLEETEEVQAAQDYMGQQKDRLMQMSYTEFEAYILGSNPATSKKDIKIAYNNMHKNDGKQVPITTADNEMSDAQLQVWAFDVLQNPKSCQDLRKAIKILKLDISESEIQKECQKINSKQ